MTTGEFNAGGNPATPSRFMPLKPEISTGLMDHLARIQNIQHPSLVISIGNRMNASTIKNLQSASDI